MKNLTRYLVLLISSYLMVACSGSSRVPLEIYSEPLGAHVIMKSARAESPHGNGPEWIYLGVTPLKTTRIFTSKELSSSNVVTLKVLRTGLVEQLREWNGYEVKRSVRDYDMVYWNAQLVPSR